MSRRRTAKGQVLVETAIILPVFVFLLLGILQLGLMHHGRLMAKYAAYKAARAGSVHRAQHDKMVNAALAVVVPVQGRDSTSGAPYRTTSGSEYAQAFRNHADNRQDTIPIVEVTVCNPLQGMITEMDDFDDPRTLNRGSTAPGGPTPPAGPPVDPSDPTAVQQQDLSAPGDWRAFNAAKLQVQVTLYFRLAIPFANWMIYRLAAGQTDAAVRTGVGEKMRWLGWKKDPTKSASRTIVAKLGDLADGGKYFVPIRQNYAMRLHSNVFDVQRNLPGSNECKIPWRKQ